MQADQIRVICHRNFGVGSDGILWGPLPSQVAPFKLRIFNPDGSEGSCAACHTRHDFSAAQARTPDTCGKCHMGPDHPQIEIYNESKHGIQFRANIAKMNLESKIWVVGKDYSAAPTCATCHMSATPNQLTTHDVGDRISFTLRPVVSFKLENWEKRRAAMKDVGLGTPATRASIIETLLARKYAVRVPPSYAMAVAATAFAPRVPTSSCVVKTK